MTRLTARTATLTVVAQTAARGVTLGFVVLSSAVVARAMGVDEFADWATALSLVVLFSFLLDPGISPIVVRRLVQDPGATPTPAAMRSLRAACGVIAFALVVAITMVLRGAEAALLAAALAAQLIPRALVLNATPFLQADHRLHRQTWLEATTASVGLVLLVGASIAGADPVVLALAGFALPTVLLAVLMRRELARTPAAHVPPPGPQRARVRSLLVEVAPLAAALALVALYMRLSTVFVNATGDDRDVALFLFAFQFVEQVIVLAGIVAGALLPMLSARGSDRALLRTPFTAELLSGVSVLGAITAAALIALAPVLTSVVGGANLEDADAYLQLLAPMAAVMLPAFLLGYAYVAVGLAKRYLWFNAVALVVAAVGHAIFTLGLGVAAAPRVGWAVELVVLALAVAPLVRASAGRLAVARVAALVAASVLAAELAYADVLAGGVAGALLVVVAALLGGGAVWRFGRALRRRPEPVATGG